MSDMARERLSKSLKNQYAKNGRKPWNKGLSVQTNTGRTHFKRGAESIMWRGGRSSLTERIRISEVYRKWRADVFRRDGWTCQTCSYRGHGRDIEAHHIIPLKTILDKVRHLGKNNDEIYNLAVGLPELADVSNGVTLCKNCHVLTYKKGKK